MEISLYTLSSISISDITNWFIEMQSNDANEKISKIFYSYYIRWSLLKVEQPKDQKGTSKIYYLNNSFHFQLFSSEL